MNVTPTSQSLSSLPKSVNELLASWGFDIFGRLAGRVRLLRHASNKKDARGRKVDVRGFYEKGLENLELYQRYQSNPHVLSDCDYIVSFVKTNSTQAAFVGIYEVVGMAKRNSGAFVQPTGAPDVIAALSPDDDFYHLERDARFDAFRDRIEIEWGKGTISWFQSLPENDKPIVRFDRPEIRANSLTPSARPPKWSTDELILALDLYFRHSPLSVSKTHPAVVQLSDTLNKLGKALGRAYHDKFRNPSGVYMKLCNFLSFDPSYSGKGLTSAGRLDKEVWDRYSGKVKELHRVAENIVANMGSLEHLVVADEDEEEGSPEGAVLYRTHLTRERNRELVRKAKERAKRNNGRLECEICSFDFVEHYGEEYIECHHKKPIAELKAGEKTKLDDLALLCANCHRMVHRRREWLSVVELRHVFEARSTTSLSR